MTTHAHQETRILIVEDDQGLAQLLQEEIEDAGFKARISHTAENGLAAAQTWMPDLIVSDLRLPGADGLALLRQIQSGMSENTPDVLIITAFGTVAKAVESLKAGAEDFLTKPLDLEHFRLSISRILEKRRMREELSRIRTLLDADSAFHGMYGRSPAMLALFQQIRQIARADGPVLIQGESGTGKELVARAIHEESDSTAGPFLAVNCAGISEHLLESEFFGHAAGAFTGATKARQGIFTEAEGGTLLLDEISEMPAPLQAKLLRMLQDGRIRPVGSNREQQINVRIIAATNRDLEALVQAGDFREDLFYRLETFSLQAPPLRERGNDLDLLTGIFLLQFASALNKQIESISAHANDLLTRYRFPGNIRELRNTIERAVVFCHEREIRIEHLPPRIRRDIENAQSKSSPLLPNGIQIDNNSLPSLEEVERRYIRHVMTMVNGNKRLAASILGIGRRTLYRRIEEMLQP
ncbi:MAG: sigma-54-dependent Fis family transcriptional regulator [Spartobacteria bacterium]|nr:sigma-54-dependent Fis family transcriptional regulator [Spartobacteria bacterium]